MQPACPSNLAGRVSLQPSVALAWLRRAPPRAGPPPRGSPPDSASLGQGGGRFLRALPAQPPTSSFAPCPADGGRGRGRAGQGAVGFAGRPPSCAAALPPRLEWRGRHGRRGTGGFPSCRRPGLLYACKTRVARSRWRRLTDSPRRSAAACQDMRSAERRYRRPCCEGGRSSGPRGPAGQAALCDGDKPVRRRLKKAQSGMRVPVPPSQEYGFGP